jgi:hypothetical protein
MELNPNMRKVMFMIKSTTVIAVVFVAIIAAIALFSFVSLNGSVVGGIPSVSAIEVNPKSHDFGTIPKEAVSHTFSVKNTGTAVLQIKKISTSCACTTAEIDLKNIGPGQSAIMVVTFDPNKMDEIEENVYRIVYIKSNDPDHPEVEVEVRATVIGGTK